MSRILIVDDDQRIVQLLSDSFKQIYTVEIAMNADEALTIIRRQRPDLVLLDIVLPGVSGLHVLQEIKRIDPTIAVVMITGSGNATLESQAVEAGAEGFMRKPFELSHLDRLVTDILASRSRRPSSLR